MHIDLKSRTRRLRDERGFSIVEAMIGVAIVAITALAMFQMSIISNRLSKNTKGANDFNALVNEIRGMLYTEQSCRLAIGGPLTMGGADIGTRTQTWSNGMGIYLYRPIAMGAVFLADPSATIPGPPTLAERTWNEWEIQDLKLQLVPGVPGVANLVPVQLNITGRRQSENQDYFRASSEIRLTIEWRLDGGGNQKIISCQSLNYSTDAGRAPVCGSDETLVTRDGRLMCAQIRCFPPDTRIIGFDADGSVICGPPL